MKKSILIFIVICWSSIAISQTETLLNIPHLETSASVDTLVTPDKIYVSIILDEKDTRNKQSTEELELIMIEVLKRYKVDVDKDLTVVDFSSDYHSYFLSSKKVLKAKLFSLIVYDAFTLSKILTGLEQREISNVFITHTDFSKKEELLLSLNSKAMQRAKDKAQSFIKPLNQKLGKALVISDQSNSDFVQRLSGQVQGIHIRGASSMPTSDQEYIEGIKFEDLKFTATVNVTFAIE